VKSRVPLGIAEQHIQRIGNLRREVVDIGVPLVVVGGGEEQLGVVVQKHEPHIVDGPNPVRTLEVAFQQLQQATKPLRSAVRERKDQGELRDPAPTSADPTGALRHRRRCQLLFESRKRFLERDFAKLWRVGVQLAQLLDLLLDVLLRRVRSLRLRLRCRLLLGRHCRGFLSISG
jgi:hypothetical protein